MTPRGATLLDATTCKEDGEHRALLHAGQRRSYGPSSTAHANDPTSQLELWDAAVAGAEVDPEKAELRRRRRSARTLPSLRLVWRCACTGTDIADSAAWSGKYVGQPRGLAESALLSDAITGPGKRPTRFFPSLRVGRRR